MVVKEAKKQECLRHLLTGHSLKECAKLCNVSYQTLSHYVREPDFIRQLRSLSEEVYQELDKQIALAKTTAAQRIDELSMKALDRMEAIIDKGGDNVAYKACQDILDRNIEVPRNRRFEGEVTQKVFDPAALIHAAAVANELQQAHETIEGEQAGG